MEQKKHKIFDGLIERIWGTSINPPIFYGTENYNSSENEFEESEDEYEPARTVPNIEYTYDANGELLNQKPAYITK